MSANAPEDAETDASESPEDSAAVLSLSEVFDVLQNARRRHVLKHLRGTEVAEFDDLVDYVAACDAGVEPGGADSGTRKAAYTSLYQSHLPKLADLGVVEYDHDAGRIGRGPCFEDVLACLETIERVRGDDDGTPPAPESEEEEGRRKGPLESLRSALGL